MEKKLIKPQATLFPLGLRVGKTRSTLILDFLNDRDDETIEVCSSIAIDYEMANKLIEELSEFVDDLDERNDNQE